VFGEDDRGHAGGNRTDASRVFPGMEVRVNDIGPVLA
jgi:hypothetical protein